MADVIADTTKPKPPRTIGAGLFTFFFAPLVAAATAAAVSYIAPLLGASASVDYEGGVTATSQLNLLLKESAIIYVVGLVPAAVIALAFMRSLRRTGTVPLLYGVALGALVPVTLHLGLSLAVTAGRAALDWNINTLLTLIWMAGMGAIAGLVTSAFLRKGT